MNKPISEEEKNTNQNETETTNAGAAEIESELMFEQQHVEQTDAWLKMKSNAKSVSCNPEWKAVIKFMRTSFAYYAMPYYYKYVSMENCT